MKKKIGFIGQGWIGKNYANDFEKRGYNVVRYALEEQYVGNKEQIKQCDVVFIAVPTPTTKFGFDDSYVSDALLVVKEGTVVVIKSTLTVGTTKRLQTAFPDITVFHSPEFLAEKTAAHDAAHPNRNLVGIPLDTPEYRLLAQQVLDILPDSPYEHILDSNDAELVKYAGNCFLYTKVIFMNILYDLVESKVGNWERVRDALVHDPRIGLSHTEPVHFSGHEKNRKGQKRGAGGHCFIKDFETFRQMIDQELSSQGDVRALLENMIAYNNRLLNESGKDLDLLESVYGNGK
jgi:UDPglucose 6-dehydrogenase